MSNKGARTERELVRLFDEMGYTSLRLAASGGGTTRDLPDVHAARDGGRGHYAIECKARKSGVVYLTADEVDALKRFAEAYGATALIGVRWDRKPWAFYYPNALGRTKSGNYKVEPDTWPGLSLDDLAATE